MPKHSILIAGLAIGMGALLLASAARCDDDGDAIVAADEALGLASFEGLAATSSHFVLSPHGIGATMATATAGSRGETRKDVVQVPGHDPNAAENADNGPEVRLASDRDDGKDRIEDRFSVKPASSPVSGARIGGPCSYASFPGRCTILSVQKTGASIRQKSVGGGPGYEGYEVKFGFAGEVPADNKSARQTLEREHELRLMNSWYPGPRFLDKYGIAAGKTFSCTLKVIEKGACSPTAFEFPAISQTDYFESGR